MIHESTPATITELPPDLQEAIVLYDNEEMMQHFGATAAELADKPMEYGSYSGTLRQMLSDPRCPANGIWYAAHRKDPEHGITGRIAKLRDDGAKFGAECVSSQSPNNVVDDSKKKT